MKRIYKLPVILAALAVFSCLDIRVAGPEKEGNSSETIAMVGGRVVDVNGAGVFAAFVTLVPDSYNPITGHALPSGLSTRSNKNGEFFLSKVPKGKYGVEAKHPKDGSQFFSSGLNLAMETSIPAVTLRASGYVRLRLPDYLKEAKGSVFIPHSRRAWRLTGTMLEHGNMVLDSLAAGNIANLAYSPDTGMERADTLGRNLTIVPEDTLEVNVLAGWSHVASITINTQASGAGVNEAVTGFPMLLRLQAQNFNFSEAGSGGQDLRFTKPNGAPLAHQIDHWDSAKSEAAIWVALDTVRGNDATQYFKMYWGKKVADSRSDGISVFSGTAGFSGVWHIEEEVAGSGAKGLYRNSAANFDHGFDSLTTQDQGGQIGNGHFFQNGEYIRVPIATAALKPNPAVTLSAWVKSTSTDLLGGEIASMGNSVGLRIYSDGNPYLFYYLMPNGVPENYILLAGGLNLLDDKWHLIVGVMATWKPPWISLAISTKYASIREYPQRPRYDFLMRPRNRDPRC